MPGVLDGEGRRRWWALPALEGGEGLLQVVLRGMVGLRTEQTSHQFGMLPIPEPPGTELQTLGASLPQEEATQCEMEMKVKMKQ